MNIIDNLTLFGLSQVWDHKHYMIDEFLELQINRINRDERMKSMVAVLCSEIYMDYENTIQDVDKTLLMLGVVSYMQFSIRKPKDYDIRMLSLMINTYLRLDKRTEIERELYLIELYKKCAKKETIIF